MRWRRVAVRGPSMSPALRDGDVVLVRFGARGAAGDVVLVRWASRPGQLSVKRAVRPRRGGWWVRGDNPFGSTDSATLGPAAGRRRGAGRLWPRPGRPAPPRRRADSGAVLGARNAAVAASRAAPGTVTRVPDSPTSGSGPRHPAAARGGAVRHRDPAHTREAPRCTASGRPAQRRAPTTRTRGSPTR